jgi:D-alanyl-D-alanine carboxypeptidase
MGLGPRAPSHCLAIVGLLAALSLAAASWDGAQARGARHHGKQSASHEKHHVVHGRNYNPPYSAIVVDANSDKVLHEESPDEPRHPASLTKIMTLYLLFEQIDAGKFKLDTPLQISSHAAEQNPTKLGLRANQTISVEDAIKGMCTKSANDAAVVVGEALGGSEDEFAKLMTEKAKALGMERTVYVNASGLPAEEQITTARDQATLGRAIQDRFPKYYRYFSTLSFRYHGKEMHNHNGLLGQVRGVDGIKTGYTEASGYNLVANVRRDDRHIIAVVLGGKSGAARNERMRQLIEQQILVAAVKPAGAPAVMQAEGPEGAPSNATAAPALASSETSPAAKPSRAGRARISHRSAPAVRAQRVSW